MASEFDCPFWGHGVDDLVTFGALARLAITNLTRRMATLLVLLPIPRIGLTTM